MLPVAASPNAIKQSSRVTGRNSMTIRKGMLSPARINPNETSMQRGGMGISKIRANLRTTCRGARFNLYEWVRAAIINLQENSNYNDRIAGNEWLVITQPG
jgi:hypothetical protein